MIEILCIFTESGHTFTFKDVTIICNNETVLDFNYKAMSDGFEKQGTFLKSRIVGWSISRDGRRKDQPWMKMEA